MAYVAPTIRSAGDAVTAADYNIMANNALQFAPFVQGVFTTEAVRDAAITSPTEGMHAYLTASTVAAATGAITAVPTGVQTIYNGTNWVCVTPIGSRSTTSGTSTSGSFVTTLTGDATPISVTLVTGTSALVSMHDSNSNTALNTMYLSFAVSGATTLAANTDNGALAAAGQNGFTNCLDHSLVITGLTAGTNTFTLSYAAAGGTGSHTSRSIVVQGIA